MSPPLPSRPYDRRAVWGWALYDFANSVYTTVIVTFIYGIFFKDVIVGDDIVGQSLWTRGVTVTGLVVAVTSPFLGALADRGGIRRPLLLTSTLMCVVLTALLYFAEAGDVMLALTLFVVSNVFYEWCGVFYNSYLPDLAPPERIGRISGYGWALGYAGGLLLTGLVFFFLIIPDTPPFGLDAATGQHVRVITVLVAVWFAVFSIPMFRWVKEPSGVEGRPSAQEILGEAKDQVVSTFHRIRTGYTDIFRLLIARMFYNDGLVTVFSVGPLFMSDVFDLELEQVLYWGLGVQVASGVGAFLMGFLDDRLGGKRTVLVTVVGLIVGGAWAVTTTSLTSVYLAGFWVGIFVGPNQAASRSLLGRFVPKAKETEFYGFFAFSGKAIAFAGPFLYGEITRLTGNARYGMATILFFFVVGGLLLLTVDESRGIAVREAEDTRAPTPLA